MTTYKIEATIGTVVVSELITLDTNLSPQKEINQAEQLAIEKWSSLFSYDFNLNADEITAYTFKQS